MKNILILCIVSSSLVGLCRAENAPRKLLVDPILRIIDGKKGIFDAKKIENTGWLIQQIRKIHAGEIRVDSEGNPDPRSEITTKLKFKGKEQNILSLLELEERKSSLSPEDQEELEEVFLLLKRYFGIINEMMVADARGAQEFMVKLIKEFCRKYNRPKSVLLHWNKSSSETEMYERDITSFKIFYVFSNDLMLFLAVLIKSCPKALASFNATRKKG